MLFLKLDFLFLGLIKLRIGVVKFIIKLTILALIVFSLGRVLLESSILFGKISIFIRPIILNSIILDVLALGTRPFFRELII